MASLTVRAAEELPRLIRLRDAPSYLGMDRNRFNQTVRPSLIEIPIGDQGIAFDLTLGQRIIRLATDARRRRRKF
jgi:hypothetical protein